MRKKIHDQLSLVYPLIDHEHAAELRNISALLDRMPFAAELVFEDLVRDVGDIDNGRPGLSGDQVLRGLVLKQMNGFSYQELAFHLADSRSYRAFCGVGIDEKSPSRSTLQANLKKIRPQTVETINRLLLVLARDDGIEPGRQVRFDCTVVEANIHDPSDSSLLWDSVRVLARLLERGRQLTPVPITNHTRRAKRRALAIRNAKTRRQRTRLIEGGNPADSSLAVAMVRRQEKLYSRPPRQVAYDGGFASQSNLQDIKSAGVQNVMFSKKRGLRVPDKVKSMWVYKRLRNWRAGIEGIISFLKPCFGLGRCLWRGEMSFRSYVWGSVLSANLLIFARHSME